MLKRAQATYRLRHKGVTRLRASSHIVDHLNIDPELQEKAIEFVIDTSISQDGAVALLFLSNGHLIYVLEVKESGITRKTECYHGSIPSTRTNLAPTS